jgi:hypothetical protein
VGTTLSPLRVLSVSCFSPAACAAGHILPPLHCVNPEFCFSVASEFEFSRALFRTWAQSKSPPVAVRREVLTRSLKGWAEEEGVCRGWESRLLQLEFHLDLCLGGNGFAIQFERLVLPTAHGI